MFAGCALETTQRMRGMRRGADARRLSVRSSVEEYALIAGGGAII
jgi:hypothetical protein